MLIVWFHNGWSLNLFGTVNLFHICYYFNKYYQLYTMMAKNIWKILHGGAKKNIVFYHEKMKFISSSHRVIFFLLYKQKYFCTDSVRAGNDLIDRSRHVCCFLSLYQY